MRSYSGGVGLLHFPAPPKSYRKLLLRLPEVYDISKGNEMYEAEAKAMKEFLEKARAIQKDINEINESEIENKAERNLIDYLDKIGHDVVKHEPENKKILVREFGERIGYGNLMQLASECWQESLKAKGLPPGGAFSVGLPYDLLIKKESEEEMTTSIRYKCKECAVSIILHVSGSPRDQEIVVQKSDNLFRICHRCYNEMEKYRSDGYGRWIKLSENLGSEDK